MATDSPKWDNVRVGVSVLIQHPKSKDNKELSILLGRRQGSHGAGTWGLPGGHIDPKEPSFEACAKREVEEETNLKITNVKFLTASNDIFWQDRKHYVTIFVTAEVVEETLDKDRNPEVILMEEKKCSGWAWFPWSKIKALQEAQKDFPENREFKPTEDIPKRTTTDPLFLPVINLIKQGGDVAQSWADSFASAS